jgi:hypothetical protein
MLNPAERFTPQVEAELRRNISIIGGFYRSFHAGLTRTSCGYVITLLGVKAATNGTPRLAFNPPHTQNQPR